MHTGCGLFFSSLGKKFVLALTGLGLAGFVLIHVIGNILLYKGSDAYNGYSAMWTHLPYFVAIELALALLAATHVGFAGWTTLQNWAAQGGRESYTTTRGAKGVTFASKTMIWQGLIILGFGLTHLTQLRFGPENLISVNGKEMRDLYQMVIDLFHSPLYTGLYVLVGFVLGLHLSHGVQSAFQSLGLQHPRYTRWVKGLGWIFALAVGGGFLLQPIYVFFFV